MLPHIIYKIIFSIIKSYITFAITVINSKEHEIIIKINVNNIEEISKQLLGLWITITPGTIYIKHSQNIMHIHSLCGDSSKELREMYKFIEKCEKTIK